MPTGYTAPVADGKVTDFATFAMQCARAFGALIEMRDAPVDAEIPDEFKPSGYYEKQIGQREAELRRLQSMTLEQAEESARADHRDAVKRWHERIAERNRTRARYEAMLAETRAWEPPTPEHEGLKKFMIEQLEESIRFDCSGGYDVEPQPVDAATWLARQVAEASRSLDWARKYHDEEVERVRGRNQWVRDLRESLQVTR